MCKNRTAPSNLPASLLLCQIWNNYLLPKLSVCVLNYTEDICLCVNLYRSYLFVCQIWNNYLLPKLSLATNIYHASTHSVSSCKYLWCHMHLLLPIGSIITYKIYYLQCPETFKFCLNHWQTHFNLKVSNGTLFRKRSNMTLPVKKL